MYKYRFCKKKKKKVMFVLNKNFHTHERGRRKNALQNAMEQKSIQMKKNVLEKNPLRLIETVDRAGYSLNYKMSFLYLLVIVR